ncbi:hypothetical protein ABVK25_012553 [Lepraria finkii]|uniref:Uncharacterized protein n=1 Tax=Lepraria finkii TaxID=1340010 RepID=A0ABR4AD47_9LECA
MKRPTPHGLSQDKTVAPEASGIDHTMLAREAEWQREREAVSRRIDMANKSQVVVIESDDDEDPPGYDDDDEDRSDIWQAEASQSREPTPEASEILLKPQVVKPRRSKLPAHGGVTARFCIVMRSSPQRQISSGSQTDPRRKHR